MATDFMAELSEAPHLESFYLERFYGDVFDRGEVPRRTKELMRLRLSRGHGCAS